MVQKVLETWPEILRRHEEEKMELLAEHFHLPISQAAELLKVSPKSLYAYMTHRGMKWPTSGRIGGAMIAEDARKIRVKLAERGASQEEIESRTGITMGSFRQWCHSNGVEIRR